jgi:CheY-like chemotaxis protein
MESIGTLAGGIAHNFNNLLMGILGNASLMLLDTEAEHPNYERLKTIEKLVQNGSGLTKQLLGYARAGNYQVKSLDLNRLVKETSDTFAATKKEIRVHQDLNGDIWTFKGDQEQIEQVLLNLYVNASEAMPDGGDLYLVTKNVSHKDMKGDRYDPKQGNYLMVSIRDTGTGIAKEEIERIFDPFFTTKGLAESTGLGLASVYGTVKSHGGYIEVDSEVGIGTTFRVYLPAIEEELPAEKEPSHEIREGQESVLLVDDEDMVIDIGKQMLEKLGYAVMVANNGNDAVSLYQNNQAWTDMVLLDMIMPDMGGGAVYDKLKQMDPNVKVLLSSGYSIEGQATEILNRGCDGFIQKPFNITELSQKIREVLDKE